MNGFRGIAVGSAWIVAIAMTQPRGLEDRYGEFLRLARSAYAGARTEVALAALVAVVTAEELRLRNEPEPAESIRGVLGPVWAAAALISRDMGLGNEARMFRASAHICGIRLDGSTFVGITFSSARLQWLREQNGSEIAAVLEPFETTRRKARIASMKSDLRNLITAQEAFFSDNSSRYAPSIAALRETYRASSGVIVRISESSGTGWRATAVHRDDDGLNCTIHVGGASDTEGEPQCTIGPLSPSAAKKP